MAKYNLLSVVTMATPRLADLSFVVLTFLGLLFCQRIGPVWTAQVAILGGIDSIPRFDK